MSLESVQFEIEFPSGRTKSFYLEEFDYYARTNELQHKSEPIIIDLSDLSKSFMSELGDNDEMANKEFVVVRL